MKKRELLSVRLTETEKRAIEEAAKLADVNTSEFARNRLRIVLQRQGLLPKPKPAK